MTSNTEPDLDDIIAEYLLAAETGNAPPAKEWLARHPQHAAGLVAFFKDLGRFGSFIGLEPMADLEQTTAYHDESSLPALEHGEPFGGYELLGEIGQGGMGTVYRARLTGTSLIVALKQLRPEDRTGGAAKRFREEIERAAELKHPNIVPVYHIGEHLGKPFFTMALVEGGSLDRNLEKFHHDPKASAQLMAKIARGVHHAHQRRILHRDLKPANVLLDLTGEPLIADFGLATRTNEAGHVTEVSAPSGSLPWMAPETLRQAPLTTAVDIWALGVMLFELLTGVRPFRGTTVHELRKAILHGQPPTLRSINPKIPLDLEAICRRCLAADPDQRYESASAVALDLERWLRDEPVRARVSGRWERFTRWCRRSPGLAAALALSVVVLTALTAAGLSSASEMSTRLAEAVCRNNEYAARQLAVIVQGRFVTIGEELLRTTADAELQLACLKNDRAAIEQILNLREQASTGGRVKNLFVLNPSGLIVATSEQSGRELKQAFTGRDYFRQALAKFNARGLGRIHVSRVFKSENDDLDKLAVSVAFRPKTGSEPWVLVATVTTDATVGQNDLPTDAMKAVLIAPMDPEPPRSGAPAEPAGYVIMAHPAFGRGEKSVRFPPGQPGPLVPRLDRGPELASTMSEAPFPANVNHTDPVGQVGHPEYRGRWLSGSARVGDTEMIVLVQQNYADAVAPHEGVFGRFLVWVCGLIGTGLIVFLILRLRR